MGIQIFQVDAFTHSPFSGNPAAVCVLEQPKDDGWMQDVAREMNLSETAFLIKEREGFELRWFTPSVEVDLCGHATLAGAHILWESGCLRQDQEAVFFTRSGTLKAKLDGEWIELDFPSEPAKLADAPPDLVKALGINPLYIGRNRFDYLVEVDSEEAVRNLRPDLPLLASVETRGVIVTSRSSNSGYDFVSRFFAPAAGIDEDPVTGSAHCCLGPYWKSRLGKEEFTAYQASSRGGVVKVRVNGDRVYLGGHAVTVLRGELVNI